MLPFELTGKEWLAVLAVAALVFMGALWVWGWTAAIVLGVVVLAIPVALMVLALVMWVASGGH